MSQEVSKWLGSMGSYNLLLNRIYWGNNQHTKLLLTSCQVVQTIIFLRSSPGLLYGPGGKNIHFTKMVNGHGLAWKFGALEFNLAFSSAKIPVSKPRQSTRRNNPIVALKKNGQGNDHRNRSSSKRQG